MNITPQLHVGRANHVGPLSVFPVWTDLAPPDRPIPTALPPGATVGEMPDGSQVAKLRLNNPTGSIFMLPGGTTFGAGWQHRVLTTSVLVEGPMQMDLDVRCVEQGRWNGGTSQRVGTRRAPLAVRGALRGIRRTDNPGGNERADQADVWSRVQRYEATLGASPSRSMVEVAASVEAHLPLVLEALRVLPGQQGVIIGIGGRPALVEVFDHPATLADQWAAIIGGVLADAAMAPSQQTPNRRARRFAARISGQPLSSGDGPRSRVEWTAPDGLATVDALLTSTDHLVHFAALNPRHDLVCAA